MVFPVYVSVFAPNTPAVIDARLTNNKQDALVASFRSLPISDNNLPLRPDFGNAGTPVKLRANFLVKTTSIFVAAACYSISFKQCVKYFDYLHHDGETVVIKAPKDLSHGQEEIFKGLAYIFLPAYTLNIV